MWFGVGIVGVIIWIAIAFWPARVAHRKGHSFIGFFLLSLLFFPLALIMAYVVQDRHGSLSGSPGRPSGSPGTATFEHTARES